jgi:hypothetical protein
MKPLNNNKMENHEFIVRSTTVGDLMTQGRTKDAKWGDTALGAIRKAVLFNKYGIEESISSKHMEKGVLNEMEGLEMYREHTGLNFSINDVKQRYMNNYCSGEPDLIHDGIIVDIKNSWTANSFPWWDDSIKNKSYIYQLQTYMWLCDLKKAKLVYTLTTTPEHIRMQEIQRLWYRLMDKPENALKEQYEVELMAEEMITKEMVFDHIPRKNRIKIFEIDRDDEMIESIKNRILEARVKYDELYNLI